MIRINELHMILSTASIQEDRMKRLANETEQVDPTKVEKLRLSENVLERNLSPSLQTKS